MSKGELGEKSLFKNEQAQKEGSFISRLNAYLETREGFLCLVFLYKV
jgi:hypothetical protein